jgi:hypothetical protein
VLLLVQAAAAAGAVPPPQTPALPGPTGEDRDLTTRYRLVERYAVEEGPDLLTSYEVAYRETVKVMVETAQAAPRVEEVRRSGRFGERVAAVAPLDGRTVSAVVRRYEEAAVTPDPWTATGAPPLMSGLDLYLVGLGSASPRLIVLTPERALWEHEYRFALGNPAVPVLAALLPERPLRLGDTWAISQTGAAALLGEPVQGGTLTGKLAEIRPEGLPEAAASDETAVLDIEGQVQTRSGPTAARARVEFAFRLLPSAGSELASGTSRDTALVAVGGIVSIRHAQVTSSAADPEQGIPGFEQRRELVLRRRWPPQAAVPSVPAAPPSADDRNSWLILADPQGRFHLRHPQILQWDAAASNGDRITLVQSRGQTPDLLVLDFLPDRQPKPDDAFRGAFDRYKEAGFEVLPLDPRALPEEEWPGMKAYRVEAVISPPAEAATLPRTHLDGYVLLTSGSAAFQAMALTTSTDEVQAFRALVEEVLKTLRLGRP